MAAKKTKFEEFISDMKSITQIPMFTLSPAKKIEREDGDAKKDEKVKTKILEAWNNIRYDLGPIATLKKDMPIWILGLCHHWRSSATDLSDKLEDDVFDSILDRRIYTDFASRPRFTYRKNFPPIQGTDITNDTGWGCMLRSAQMMVAQGLLFHFLGRDWRWLTRDPHDQREKNLHKEIIGWFIDDPGCPLSIHRLSEIGRRFGNIPGNWYGPNTVSYIMKHAMDEAREKHPKLREVAIYVAVDCTVYSEDVYDLCEWRKDPPEEQPGTSAEQNDRDRSSTKYSAESDSRTEPSKSKSSPKVADHSPTDVPGYKTDMGEPASPSCDTDDGPDPAEAHQRTESWCEVSEITTTESYENFKKYTEGFGKQHAKKSRFKFKRTKKDKVSLYKGAGERDAPQLNGRVIMPHFRVEKPGTSRVSPTGVSLDMGVAIGVDTTDSAKRAVYVKSEFPSPILYRNSNIGDADDTPSPPHPISALSFFPCDENRKIDDKDSFLSSFIEHSVVEQNTDSELKPVGHDYDSVGTGEFQSNLGSGPGGTDLVHSRDGSFEPEFLPCVENQKIYDKDSFLSPNIETIDSNQNADSGLKSVNCDNDSAKSSEFRSNFGSDHDGTHLEHCRDGSFKLNFSRVTKLGDEIDGRNRTPKHGSLKFETRPGTVQHSARLLRRSSSTPGVRERSATLGGDSTLKRNRGVRNKSLPSRESSRHKAVLILIPVRLGESALNPIYAPCVEAMLSLESSVGIIGGRPKHSLYFVGCQGPQLLHLDPHYCQPADTLNGFGKNLHDYHTTQIRKINVRKIDPSCCLGFYCRSPEEFERFKVDGAKNFTPPQQPVSYPMCLIMDGRSGDHKIATPPDSPYPDEFSGVTKPTELPFESYGFESTYEGHSLSTGAKSEHSSVTSNTKKKKKANSSMIEGASSKFTKFNPLSKFMRNKSAADKRKSDSGQEEESLESQFELL